MFVLKLGSGVKIIGEEEKMCYVLIVLIVFKNVLEFYLEIFFEWYK